MALRVGFNARVLADPHLRGLTRYTINLLRALSRRNDVELILFTDRELISAHLGGIRAQVVVLGASRETFWEAWILPQALRRHRIDVFHAPADRGLPWVKPCPCVVTLHNSFERSHWRTLFDTTRRRYWYWKNELLNRTRADAVITVSDTTLRELRALGVVPERLLRRVYLAAAPEFSPTPLPEDAEILSRHGISGAYLLYVGGYDKHKNVDALVRAFDRSRLPNHSLVVAASKHRWYSELVAKWRDLSCFSRMRLIEPQTSELPSLYRGASYFVNPSLWESFSFQLLEAMACGTPILASNRTAIPEIAGDAALYFDPAASAGSPAFLERMAGDVDLRSTLRTEGFARVRDFSWDRAADETLLVYKEIRDARQHDS